MKCEEIGTDVLVIGSGIAGLSAAIQARQEGCDVLLASKASIGKQSCTWFSGGSFGGQRRDRLHDISFDVANRYLYDPELLEVILAKAPNEIKNLERYGIYFEEKRGRHHVLNANQKEKGGPLFVSPLLKVIKDSGIKTIGSCMVTDLLTKDGECLGALGLTIAGEALAIKAKSTVLATGGGDAIYQYTTSPRGIVGDGYAIALRAGINLINMEMIQFELGFTGAHFPYQQVGTGVKFLAGSKLVNQKGEDIIKKYLGISWKDGVYFSSFKFEESILAVAKSMKEGKVFFDLTSFSEDEWQALSPHMRRELEKCPVNLRIQPAPVQPLGHTFLGGLRVNKRAESSLPSLFAAGEIAAANYNGDDGPNHLGYSLTMGAIAGSYASERARKLKMPQLTTADWQEELNVISSLSGADGRLKPREISSRLRGLVYEHAGPLRNASSLKQGLEKLEEVKREKSEMKVQHTADLREAIEIKNMLLLAETIFRSALLREESRGPHCREDFPQKNDKDWLKFTSATLDKKNECISVKPALLDLTKIQKW